MAYQVLARKWRPATFSALVGQEHVLQALRHALDNERLHHAYLFTGTRGVGKTTIARILARCLNCERGISAEPCGECSACREVAEGRSVDLIEVDAASRTKVEDTRELLENVQYAPTHARFKIYLIDEVHMLSGHSFNALLKTLEEPPEHVKFLLATTDPQKLPATVLSRCLQFNLKNLSAERIAAYLSEVLTEEGIAFEEPALWLLGRAAAGSMRDALSLTDQAIAFGSGRLGEEEVASMLGTVDRSRVFALVDALAADDGAALLGACRAMAEQGVESLAAVDELCAVLHRVAVAQALPGAEGPGFGDGEQIRALAGRLTAEDVQLFFQLASQGRALVAQSADPQAAFEMLALRLLAFRPVAVLEPVAAGTLSPPENAGEVGSPTKKPEPPPAAATQATTRSRTERLEPEAAPVAAPVGPTAAPGSQAPGRADGAAGDEEPWHAVLEALGLSGSTYTIASHCELRERTAARWLLILDAAQANLFNDRQRQRLGDALKRWGLTVPLEIEVGQPTAETPAQRQARKARERRRAARAAIEADPRVQRLLEDFDAALLEDSLEVDDAVPGPGAAGAQR